MDHEVGDILYVLPSAKEGYLEKVAIKKIVTLNNASTFFLDYILYYDTNNRRFFAEELVTLVEAQTAIAAVINPPC